MQSVIIFSFKHYVLKHGWLSRVENIAVIINTEGANTNITFDGLFVKIRNEVPECFSAPKTSR
jgi:hypothetical protein